MKRKRGLGHEGPRSKVRFHTGDGRSWRLFAAPLGHDARLVSGRQVLYNIELGNGDRVGEDVQEGKIQETYKTRTDRQGGLRGLGSLLSLV